VYVSTLAYYVTYLGFSVAEIMGKDTDLKKFRAQVGGRRELTTNFQIAKKKKYGTTSSTNTASAKNASFGAASDHVASTDTTSLVTDITMQPKASTPPSLQLRGPLILV